MPYPLPVEATHAYFGAPRGAWRGVPHLVTTPGDMRAFIRHDFDPQATRPSWALVGRNLNDPRDVSPETSLSRYLNTPATHTLRDALRRTLNDARIVAVDKPGPHPYPHPLAAFHPADVLDVSPPPMGTHDRGGWGAEDSGFRTPVGGSPVGGSPVGGSPALDTSALDTSALGTSALGTSALDTSALDTSALDTPALDTPALDTPALDTSALEPYTLDPADLTQALTRALGNPPAHARDRSVGHYLDRAMGNPSDRSVRHYRERAGRNLPYEPVGSPGFPPRG